MDDLATLPAALPATQACGWYGKLPALGDFSARRLPTAMVDQCDAWLSAGLAASQQALGPQWLDTYLTAPVWRFAWAPGIAGSAWWLGVLMPSVDRVGRYFPLLLAAPCPAAGLDTTGTDTLVAWLNRLADTAQDCLRPGARLEDLEAALGADLPPWDRSLPPMAASPLSAPGWRTGGRQRHALPPNAQPASLLARVAREQLLARLSGHSLWWSGPGADWESSLTWTPGLPSASEFASLLDGHW